ncbi:MAG: hypothetical protein ACTSP4_17025 [Candidatus Hodarchaeales archaeon]
MYSLNIESEIREIKKHLLDVSAKLDKILADKEVLSMMKLSESSLASFLSSEPDIYNIQDLKVRYR